MPSTDAAGRLDNIALFDLDGSLADYSGQMLRDMQRLAGPEEPPLTPENLWERDDLPHLRARMTLIMAQPGWWSGLAPIEAGFRVLNAARDAGFRIHVLTKGPRAHPRAWAEKLEWVQEHIGPDADITTTMDKGLVYGRVLYDDYPAYLERWLQHRPRGLGIMPAAPGNAGFSHPNVLRWTGENFDEVRAALAHALSRAPGEDLALHPRP
jgi:5'(3')-deoxyribonucleotidase